MENLDDFEIVDSQGRVNQNSVYEANRHIDEKQSQLVPVMSKSQMDAWLDDRVHKIEEFQKSKGGSVAPLISSFYDPWNMADFQGNRQKQSRITWQILRRMALSCKPIAAIIKVRQNQIASFTQVPRRPGELGFRVTTLNPKEVPTESKKKRIKEMQDFLLRTGYPITEKEKVAGDERTDNFDTFIRKLVNDTLVLDATVAERQFKRNGSLHAVWAVDGASIKFRAPEYHYDSITNKPIPETVEKTNGYPAKYVQELINGQRVAVYNTQELIYEVMNPRTDIDVGGYGLAPLEILMETVTAILFGEQYNQKYFTQNSVPQGVLNISGKYTQENLEAFKRQWVAQVAGVGNAWRVPIMAIDEKGGQVDFKSFKQSNKDMEYQLWIEYLIQLACAVFCIDPSEVGFLIKGSGGAPMVENSGSVKIDFSKDKGLRPLMKFYAHIINEHIIEPIYDDLYFEWIGADAMQEDKKIDMISKKIQSGLTTVNEARAVEDMPEIKEDWANAPANATLAQIYIRGKEEKAQKKMAEQQQQQQQEGMMTEGLNGEQGDQQDGEKGDQQDGEQGGMPAPQPPQGAGKPRPLSDLTGSPFSPQNPKTKDLEPDLGADMPIKFRRQRDRNSPEYQADRDNEKVEKKKKRQEANVFKSQGEEEESVVISFEGE